MALDPLFSWLQGTALATAISNSRTLTGGLSALHLVGFTLVMGGAVVSNLRMVGVLFPAQPVAVVAAPAVRGIMAGLLVSAATGFLLFAPRAMAAADNGIFRFKLSMLTAALIFQFAVRRAVLRRESGAGVQRAAGAIGLLLWLSVALAGCAYIFLEE